MEYIHTHACHPVQRGRQTTFPICFPPVNISSLASKDSSRSSERTAAGLMITVVLVSYEGEEFELLLGAWRLSATIRRDLQRRPRRRVTKIRLPNIAAGTLGKVVKYCNGYASTAYAITGVNFSNLAYADHPSLERFGQGFIVGVDQAMLYDLLAVVDDETLDIKRLFDLCCKRVCDMIRGRTPEQIRQALRIDNDFTAEEEAQIRNSNSWLFDN